MLMKFLKYKKLTIYALLLICIFAVLITFSYKGVAENFFTYPSKDSWWEIQSIDTMKYSRDPAAEKLEDPGFDSEIEAQVSNIAKTGATHVGIATPYDEKFLPFLKRWVDSARRNNLKVWFRGNFSNWEGWFGFERKMTFEEHIKSSVEFIKKHPELFEDGDSFTACPECENGAQGDPRMSGKAAEYKNFLIRETDETSKAFKSINKKVSTNWLSMNGDVARLIMDKETVKKVGGVISIDHYVSTSQKLINDIDYLAKDRGAKVFLGEFGAPIPDINGKMTEDQQAEWLEEAFSKLSKNPNVIGINYWTNRGGSTEIWNGDNSPKKAVAVVTKYFTPSKINGFVEDDLGDGIDGVEVALESQKIYTKSGKFEALILVDSKVKVSKSGFKSREVEVQRDDKKQINLNITLTPDNPSMWFKIKAFLNRLFNR